MTLGMDTKRKHIARWALASTLLAGTALTAPLSLADDPTTTEVEKTVTIVVDGAEVDGLAGLEHISEENTFVFVNRNGTTGNLSGEALEEFLQEHGALAGEPGLQALTDGTRQTRSLSISRINNGEGQSFEVRKENGETRAFRIEEDGTKTEIDVSEVEGLEGLDGLDGLDALDRDWTARAEGFPRLELETENIIGLRSGEGDGQVRVFRFSDGDFPQGLTPGEDSGRFAGAMADARLRSAESMIESSTRMIEQMRESAEGSDRDLRDAERELRRAQRALEKAQEAMERHNAE